MRELIDNFFYKIEIIRSQMQLETCCKDLEKILLTKQSPLFYYSPHRVYGLLSRKTTGWGTCIFCIFCGKRLPDELNLQWKKLAKKKGLSIKVCPSKILENDDLTDDRWWKTKKIPYIITKKNLHKECFCTYDASMLNFCASQILYNTRFREYGIKQVRKRGPYIVLKYCLRCGRQFKESLKDLWIKLLQNNYNITDPLAVPLSSLPKSFRSDEWWKRRGL